MTVLTSDNITVYVGNGVTVDFMTSYRFYEETDLVVTLIAPDLSRVVQTLNVHYTVAGGDGEQGTITFVTPPTLNYWVEITRLLPITQEIR